MLKWNISQCTFMFHAHLIRRLKQPRSKYFMYINRRADDLIGQCFFQQRLIILILRNTKVTLHSSILSPRKFIKNLSVSVSQWLVSPLPCGLERIFEQTANQMPTVIRAGATGTGTELGLGEQRT